FTALLSASITPHSLHDALPILVELEATRCVAVEQRWIAGGRDVLVHFLVDAVQVVHDLRIRVPRAVEEVEVLGPVRLAGEQVVEGEAELLRELAHLRVPLVDQLTTVLGDLVPEDVSGAIAPA